jgi:parvulin-like peptidyl-prolyl isomerase
MMRAMWRTLASGLVVAVCVARAAGQAPSAKPAAVVNGEAIPMTDLKAVIDQRPSPVPLTKEQETGVHKMALDMLIEDVLMRQFLRKNMPPANQAEMNQKIGELQEVLKKQNKTVQQFLKEGGQTEEQLRTDISAQLQWKAYLKSKLPDAAVKKYYDDNKVFFDKVMVKASHILVRVKADAPQAEQQSAMAKIQAIRQEIMSNKLDFAAAATKYSDCPSKSKGGDIGLFPYKFAVVEPFAKTAFAMNIGDVSDVIKTDFGLHLIKVTDRTKGESSNFEAIKEFVRDVYAQDLNLYQNVIEEQKKIARIEVYAK